MPSSCIFNVFLWCTVLLPYNIKPQILRLVHQIICNQIPISVASPTLFSQISPAPLNFSLFSKCLISLYVFIHIMLSVKVAFSSSTSTPGKLLFSLQSKQYCCTKAHQNQIFLCKNVPDSLAMSHLSIFESQNILFMPLLQHRLHYIEVGFWGDVSASSCQALVSVITPSDTGLTINIY